MKYEDIEKTINLITEKAKTLGPSGEVVMRDITGYVSLSSALSCLFYIFPMIGLLVGIYYMTRYVTSKDPETRKDARSNEAFVVWGYLLMSVGFLILGSFLISNISRIYYPLGYIAKGLVGL